MNHLDGCRFVLLTAMIESSSSSALYCVCHLPVLGKKIKKGFLMIILSSETMLKSFAV